MPLYDYDCDSCGSFGETAVPLRDYDPKGVPCPECGCLARRRVPAVPVVGPMPSKPLVVNQISREFTSAAEVRQYERENPGVQIQSATSDSWRAHKDRAREATEVAARRDGFRDRDHRMASMRKGR